ncbi:hypothetical protein [Gemmobacter serpentinus]|uniref:hypothetical protein n=1 Tax=Gemmobacter serpentinus TaxID=2652247 RepID=UPI001CF67A9F|nr:hypothetical protein [Gemmobacter serpentinus]
MTEPMTSVEIEDVLSSIRRLVSEDLRPSHDPRDAGPRPGPTPGPELPASRLLLTPALRVVPPLPADVDRPMVTPSDMPDTPRSEAAMSDPASPDPRAAEPMPIEAAAAMPIETVVARVGAQVSDDWDTEAEAEMSPVWSALPVWNTEIVEVDLDRVEEAEVLQFTSPDAARLEEAWRDGAWAEGPQNSVAEPDASEALERESAFVDPAPYIEVDEAGYPVEPEMGRSPGDLAEAAVLEELRGLEDELAASVAAASPKSDLFAPQDSDDFDEEALREVVRDMIREELQGALGERITRNVRKLVRAEINRALASRDLS